MKITIPGCVTITALTLRWYVLELRGGMADSVFADLTKLGYDAYLPRRRIDKYNRRMRVMAERSEPLLPGYLFVAHPRPGKPADDWTEVDKIKGVRGRLKTQLGPVVIPHAVIEVIMRMEFESAYDDTQAGKRFRGESDRDKLEARFPVGASFRVIDGPFSSFLAEVETLTHDGKVKALIDVSSASCRLSSCRTSWKRSASRLRDSVIVHNRAKRLRDSCKSPICVRGRSACLCLGALGRCQRSGPSPTIPIGRNGSACLKSLRRVAAAVSSPARSKRCPLEYWPIWKSPQTLAEPLQ
ncbi:transcription termination/antitermination protein NusG [Mesorhizobium yinganensis]|uniref:transcription termination/antitermination protein NusG n=1 Tax=Mesorhizobium yinganensis TaxID=3157707 RepID=UPI0032B7696F